MPNLRGKTWTTTTPANVGDAQFWEDHLISDAVAAKAASSVQSVNNTMPDAQGNVDIVALPDGGTVGQVLTKQSSADGDADWEDPASSGHTIQDEYGIDMPYQNTLQFVSAEVTNDAVNGKTVVDCKGSKGDAATITVGTVTTLPAGSQATVVNSGTSGAAVFNFGIPKGADGSGIGDMTKAEYATNGEAGVVDEAITLKGLTASITDLNKTSNLAEVVEQIYADNGVLGAKNLLPNKATSQTINGVTFTVNEDGSVTVNGTATADTYYEYAHDIRNILVSGKDYIISGCPSGGGSTTYSVMVRYAGYDYGNGRRFTVPSSYPDYVWAGIYVKNGVVLSNVVFYPMLRLASDPDDTYTPYAMTNRELTEEKLSISELKTIASSAVDFAAFKTAIANL